MEPSMETEAVSEEGQSKEGRWTKEEHELFVEALKLYGKDWKKVQEHVGTRTTTQARSHAQKYFAKLGRKLNSDVSSVEAAESAGVAADDSKVHTQASTPVDSPLGGPCAAQKSEPSCTPSQKSTKKSSDWSKGVTKRLLNFSEKDDQGPETKTKTCSAPPATEPETRPTSQCPSAVPHLTPAEPQHAAFPLYYQQNLFQMPVFVPISTESTVTASYPELTFSVPAQGEENPAALEPVADVLELDRFQLDCEPEKPLDLGEETVKAPARTEKKNASVDFSDLFA